MTNNQLKEISFGELEVGDIFYCTENQVPEYKKIATTHRSQSENAEYQLDGDKRSENFKRHQIVLIK